MNKDITKLNIGNNKNREYKMERIKNKVVYINKSKSSHILGLYYFVSYKKYLEEKNT